MSVFNDNNCCKVLLTNNGSVNELLLLLFELLLLFNNNNAIFKKSLMEPIFDEIMNNNPKAFDLISLLIVEVEARISFANVTIELIDASCNELLMLFNDNGPDNCNIDIIESINTL